ncbi:hypothetical protein ACFQ36_13260 [Arthrobacter sp. GCM10027362]|uniref:hypothetical protein n=1 Tax=Arthrobacter sp. GCM10027362 TaxID=3273379 RepID=UPI0036300C2C
MGYFVEYHIPPGDDEDFEFPVNGEEPDDTIPLSQTEAGTVHAPDLLARTLVAGATLAEARQAAEEIIGHSGATEALLYEDPENSTQSGSGTVVGTYTQGGGWAGP